MAAIIKEAGIFISLLYQFFFIISFMSINAKSKTANCPNSTPILNANNIEIKLSFGNPYCVRRAAKPSPCNKPNANTIEYLHLLVSLKRTFSIATQTIDKAIIAYTRSPLS